MRYPRSNLQCVMFQWFAVENIWALEINVCIRRKILYSQERHTSDHYLHHFLWKRWIPLLLPFLPLHWCCIQCAVCSVKLAWLVWHVTHKHAFLARTPATLSNTATWKSLAATGPKTVLPLEICTRTNLAWSSLVAVEVEVMAVEVEVVSRLPANGTSSHSALLLHSLWKPCNHGDEDFTAAERPSDVIDRNFPLQLVNMCDDDFVTRKILLFPVS